MTSLSFGKYKHQPIEDVPDGALKYYLDWPGLRDDQRAGIEAELARRASGGGQEPRRDPGPAVRPAPARPTRQAPATDPTAGWTERRQLCAVDLIAWGAAGLLKERPESRGIIEETAEWLRTLVLHGVVSADAGPGASLAEEAPF